MEVAYEPKRGEMSPASKGGKGSGKSGKGPALPPPLPGGKGIPPPMPGGKGSPPPMPGGKGNFKGGPPVPVVKDASLKNVPMEHKLPLGRKLHWKPISQLENTVWAEIEQLEYKESGMLGQSQSPTSRNRSIGAGDRFCLSEDTDGDEKQARSREASRERADSQKRLVRADSWKVLDLDVLEQVFKTTPTSSYAADERLLSARRGKAQASLVTIIDNKRAQNIGIVLAGLGVDAGDLCERLRTLETTGFTADVLEKCQEVMPTEDEVKKLTAYQGDLSLLRDVERKLIPFCLISRTQQRLQLMTFDLLLPQQTREIREAVQTLLEASSQVRTSKGLRWVLSRVLMLGNFVNYGSTKVQNLQTKGFSVDSLLRLLDMKSPLQPDVTMLHYLIYRIHHTYNGSKKKEILLDLPKQLQLVVPAARISVDGIQKQLDHLAAEIRVVTAEMKLESKYEASAMKDIKSLHTKAQQQLDELTASFNTCENLLLELMQFFGENPKLRTATDLFHHLQVFVEAWISAIQDIQRQPAKFERAFGGALQADLSTPSSTPPTPAPQFTKSKTLPSSTATETEIGDTVAPLSARGARKSAPSLKGGMTPRTKKSQGHLDALGVSPRWTNLNAHVDPKMQELVVSGIHDNSIRCLGPNNKRGPFAEAPICNAVCVEHLPNKPKEDFTQAEDIKPTKALKQEAVQQLRWEKENSKPLNVEAESQRGGPQHTPLKEEAAQQLRWDKENSQLLNVEGESQRHDIVELPQDLATVLSQAGLKVVREEKALSPEGLKVFPAAVRTDSLALVNDSPPIPAACSVWNSLKVLSAECMKKAAVKLCSSQQSELSSGMQHKNGHKTSEEGMGFDPYYTAALAQIRSSFACSSRDLDIVDDSSTTVGPDDEETVQAFVTIAEVVGKLDCQVEWDMHDQSIVPFICEVLPGGAAERYGIRAGDRILQVNSIATRGQTREQLLPILRKRPLTLMLECKALSTSPVSAGFGEWDAEECR